MRETRNAYRILLEKSLGNSHVEDRRSCEDDMNFREMVYEDGRWTE
jgi:hypothetical protein